MSEWQLTKDLDGWYISPIGALIPFTDTNGGNADRQEAAAKAMAAAPKLLAACEALMRSEHKLPLGLWDKVESAIAAAKGGAK